MSANQYYQQGGPPQYPQQSLGDYRGVAFCHPTLKFAICYGGQPGYGQGYGGPPQQGQMYYPPQGQQGPPPQQRQKKDRGCLTACANLWPRFAAASSARRDASAALTAASAPRIAVR
ncbi:hypothetical protein K491DRAFT_672589 [Lophiostoma macrostomum CBS 122681]|uniref:Cysteine-rich transmembrane CYSTM domain-containing protein n=1 Tax=Lophiostoma macrostomum CBS 122681 TaxID=1314788 RepID=A0A6A6TSD3_9PLEO|nr:hypothetical protein K491DRAFT_672589 [Lophiostoma macrostomum CBS 122681]